MDIKVIKAETGMVFQRIHDGMIFGDEIYLGMDYSTGEKRQDKEEYYCQIAKPISEIELNQQPIVDNINSEIG